MGLGCWPMNSGALRGRINNDNGVYLEIGDNIDVTLPVKDFSQTVSGKTPRTPQGHGFMYAHGFEDLDGHI